ncbi:hypothetical protein PPL_12554 [Heterostelium album PN500]|uniref:Uncharacterized protein n=1 Tax=Heterostelium pallidum (strain ATCC 26659 / Pp 5 / PN500) TaxID=670386 RepID=D3BMY1_HETP5|nr:hypothetical protein PPL_12554 [Heterostelium album PN500]EFA77343.1 hypothetical protein PPL_12554 [Heterostelium album PN500]|eukprot:XP_020429472.1 hypothetical protein PPL_12554 [Heterostelium album PN500]
MNMQTNNQQPTSIFTNTSTQQQQHYHHLPITLEIKKLISTQQQQQQQHQYILNVNDENSTPPVSNPNSLTPDTTDIPTPSSSSATPISSSSSSSTSPKDSSSSSSSSSSSHSEESSSEGSAAISPTVGTKSNTFKTDFPIITIVNTKKSNNASVPYVLSQIQDNESERNCKGKTFCTLAGDLTAKSVFNVSYASAYDKCIGMLSNIYSRDGSVHCKISTYNTETEKMVSKNFNINKKCTNIAIDDRFIWITYDNILEVFTHEEDCGGILPTDKGKKFVNGSTYIFSDPNSRPDRAIYVYQYSSQVLSKYTYPTSLNSLTEVSKVNVGKACHISPIGIPDKVSVSYPDGFRIFKVSTSQSRNFEVGDSSTGTDFCGPFVQNGLDVFSLPKVGGKQFIKIVPGLEIHVSKPCVNSSNGRIVIEGSTERYNFTWNDINSTSPIRNMLTKGIYTVTITAREIDVSNVKEIEVYPPNDPTHANVIGTCQGESYGGLNFSLPRDPHLNYTYVLVDGNFTHINSSGFFDGLKSKNYTVNITTVDQYEFQCNYSVSLNVIEGMMPPKPVIVTQGSTCFNKSDATITIMNYQPERYVYKLYPPSPVPINNGTYINLFGSTVKDYNLMVYNAKAGLQCKTIAIITLPEPPKFKFPFFNITKPPQCYGKNSSMTIEVIKGLECILSHTTNKLIYGSYLSANGTNFYRNLPAGNYSLECFVPSRDGSICNKKTTFININQPTRVHLNSTKLNPKCNRDGKENMLLYAYGGVPINGSSYMFVGKYANATGPALNVSYWVDGVYSVNITDAQGCVTTYDNFTISRPSACALVLDQHGIPIKGGGFSLIQPGNDLALALGVGLGVGIPVLVAAIVGGVFLYRRRQRATITPSRAPNTIPIYLGVEKYHH